MPHIQFPFLPNFASKLLLRCRRCFLSISNAIIPPLAHCEFEMISKGRFRNKITIYHSSNIYLVAILSTSFSHLHTCSQQFFSIEILYVSRWKGVVRSRSSHLPFPSARWHHPGHDGSLGMWPNREEAKFLKK